MATPLRILCGLVVVLVMGFSKSIVNLLAATGATAYRRLWPLVCERPRGAPKLVFQAPAPLLERGSPASC